MEKHIITHSYSLDQPSYRWIAWLALVAELAEKDVMDRKPRATNANLFTKPVVVKIILTGLIMTVAALFMQWCAVKNGYDIRSQQTMVFAGLCLMQLLNAISVSAG